MRNLRITSPFSIAIVATVVFGLSFIWGSPFSLTGSDGAEAAGSAADAFSIDMDPANSPANMLAETGAQCGNTTDDDGDFVADDGCDPWDLGGVDPLALGVGLIQACARINENNTLDADEETLDTAQIDVVAENIPATNPMFAFAFTLSYSNANLRISTKNINQMIRAFPQSSSLDAGDSTPDTDGSLSAAVADTTATTTSSEYGDGTLMRLGLNTLAAAVAGVYPLTLSGAVHQDYPAASNLLPDALNDASVAVNRSCPLPPVDTEMIALSLVSSSPIVPVGTNFTLQAQGTARSNGPNPADIRIGIGISGPADCTLTPQGNQTEDFLNVLPTETRTSTQIWTANCATPSSHVFSASGQVTVIGLGEESTPGNNGPISAGDTVAVTGDADVKMTGVTVDAPPDAATGAPFTVNVIATMHDNGPLDPVNVDTTFDLLMPPGCTRNPDNPQTVQDTSLTLSTPVPIQVPWTVSCGTTGLKTFDGSASTVIDQLHTADPNGANNSGQGQDATDTSLGVADVKVTSVTVTSPPSVAVNTNFPVTVSTLVHNNGPFFPINADVTLTLNLPADCFTPVSTIVFQDASLGPSIAAQLPDITFYVGCISHSFHNITATANIVIDDPLAGDPNPGNNSSTSGTATTTIIRTVDFKAVSVTLGTPPSANAGTSFNVTVDSTLHNNGPDSGPAAPSVSLSLPSDCTTPVNPIATSINVNPSVSTALATQTFPVTCTGESFHDFQASVSLTAPLHVVDTNAANDIGTSLLDTVAIIGLADLKVSAAVVAALANANVNVPFNVPVTVTLHNNGLFGPVNADASVMLNMPGDCSTTDANPQAVDNVTLPVSVNVPIALTWSVTCTAKSSHSFTADSAVAPDQLHVGDPNTGNNTRSSPPDVVAVFVQSDVKITSATVLSPPTFIASNTNVPITVRTVLHNNGPFGPTGVNLARSTTPPSGCTITPPATSAHTLTFSVTATVDAVWTINCVPGTYTLSFSNTPAITELHVTDLNSGNNTASATATIAVDTDGDGIADDVENNCGSNPLNGLSIPERIDGVYAGADDDLDAASDEALPATSLGYDCDRDGYIGSSENHVYNPSTVGNQDPCGTNANPPAVPPTAIGWPADLQGGGIPDSTNLISLVDLTSFLAPIRYLNLNVGTNPGDHRWDLVPGPGVLPTDINLADLTNLILLAPPMLGNVKALNGPSCPFPP